LKNEQDMKKAEQEKWGRPSDAETHHTPAR